MFKVSLIDAYETHRQFWGNPFFFHKCPLPGLVNGKEHCDVICYFYLVWLIDILSLPKKKKKKNRKLFFYIPRKEILLYLAYGPDHSFSPIPRPHQEKHLTALLVLGICFDSTSTHTSQRQTELSLAGFESESPRFFKTLN